MLGRFLGFGVIGIETHTFVVCLLLCTSFGSARSSSCDTNGLVRRKAQK